MPRDLYDILGVARSADDATIKKAYRTLALKFHPDRNPGDKAAEDAFKEAAHAYDILGDPGKRQRYDQYGHQGVQGHDFRGVDDIFSNFGDIFDEIFGGGFAGARRGASQGPRPRQGESLQAQVEISFDDAARGLDKELELDRTHACSTCHGSGAKDGGRENCRACDGTGQVTARQGFFVLQTVCAQCRGEGWRIKNPCDDCRGRGAVRSKRKLNVKIPPGIEDGMQLVLRGEGDGGVHGGPPGDLYVVVHVQAHSHFRREGDDVIYHLELSMPHAALGTKLTVPTLYGNHELEIPAGTDTGAILRVKHQGMPNVRTGRKGDQCVEIIVRTPKKLSKRQKELLQELLKEGA